MDSTDIARTRDERHSVRTTATRVGPPRDGDTHARDGDSGTLHRDSARRVRPALGIARDVRLR